FHAHIVILHYRSPHLRRILSANKKKNDGTLTHITLPNISPEIFQIILRYIYGRSLSLNEYDNSDIIKILVIASELEPVKIFNSPNFSSIPEKLLISIIQNDDLDIRVWESVLKWELAQNPELPYNVSNYSKDDFNTLKNTLQQCIPFIRFYNITSGDFLDKVYPYKKSLPKELHNELVKLFLNLNPDSKPSDKSKPCITKEINLRIVDSKIITYQHTELISKWINRLEITDKLNFLYEFKLLFHGSHDGATCDKFHEICDNQSHIVTIIKVKDSSEILGGYNPVEWNLMFKMGVTVSTYLDKLFNEYIRPTECKNISNKTHIDFTSLVQSTNLWKDIKNKDGSVNNIDILDANLRSLDKALEKITRYEITIDELKVHDLEQPVLATSSGSTSTENTNEKSKPNKKADKSASPPKSPKKVKKEHQPHIIIGFTILPKLQQNVRDVILYDIPGKWDAEKITEEINKHLGSLVKATLSKQGKYTCVRATIVLRMTVLTIFEEGQWQILLGNTLIRWFLADWSLE
ncbi:hypothetical protein C1645_825792, partial [Glomus cerebriforme]